MRVSNDADIRHSRAVASMFGRITPWYDLLNSVLSCGIDRYWRRRLAREVRPGKGGRVLDLAAGTLDVALAVRRRFPDVTVPALDFCPPMLERGRRKLRGEAARKVIPVAADATALPLRDGSVDCLTMAFGIRNVRPREAAFAEMVRVLAPGGRACLLEFGSGQQRIWGGLYNGYLNRVLPWIGRLLSGDGSAYGYLAESIRAFPPAVALEEEMRAAGFACAWHIPLTSGIVCLHIGEKARCADLVPRQPDNDQPHGNPRQPRATQSG